MPDTSSRLTIPLTIVGLLLTAGGLWLAISDYNRKGNDARRVLDITEMKVICRLDVKTTNYVVSGEVDRISITYRNAGTVEATNVAVMDTAWDSVSELYRTAGKPPIPLIRRPDMLPGAAHTVEMIDDPIKGP